MKYLALFVLLLFAPVALVAQSASKIKKEAEKLFAEKEYQKSLNEYNKIKEKYIKDIDLKYNIGRCYYHLNNMEEAIVYLKFHSENATKPAPKTYYYLAKAHHVTNDFRAAALGTITFGLMTSNILYTEAGHSVKIYTLASIAPLFGTLIVAYRGKLLLGTGLFAFFLTI